MHVLALVLCLRLAALATGLDPSTPNTTGDNKTVHCAWASDVASFYPHSLGSWLNLDLITGHPESYPCASSGHQVLLGAPGCGVIQLKFPEALFVHRVDIYEMVGAGSVLKIAALAAAGNVTYDLWQTNASQALNCSRIFSPTLEYLPEAVDIIELSFNATLANFVEIDGVQIHGSREKPMDIRLVNGWKASAGLVEVYDSASGRWGHICDAHWWYEEARVACRQLGYRGALYAMTHFLVRDGGGGDLFLDGVHCSGNETRLSDCELADSSAHNCQGYEAAGAVCIETDDEDGQPCGSTQDSPSVCYCEVPYIADTSPACQQRVCRGDALEDPGWTSTWSWGSSAGSSSYSTFSSEGSLYDSDSVTEEGGGRSSSTDTASSTDGTTSDFGTHTAGSGESSGFGSTDEEGSGLYNSTFTPSGMESTTTDINTHTTGSGESSGFGSTDEEGSGLNNSTFTPSGMESTTTDINTHTTGIGESSGFGSTDEEGSGWYNSTFTPSGMESTTTDINTHTTSIGESSGFGSTDEEGSGWYNSTFTPSGMESTTTDINTHTTSIGESSGFGSTDEEGSGLNNSTFTPSGTESTTTDINTHTTGSGESSGFSSTDEEGSGLYNSTFTPSGMESTTTDINTHTTGSGESSGFGSTNEEGSGLFYSTFTPSGMESTTTDINTHTTGSGESSGFGSTDEEGSGLYNSTFTPSGMESTTAGINTHTTGNGETSGFSSTAEGGSGWNTTVFTLSSTDSAVTEKGSLSTSRGYGSGYSSTDVDGSGLSSAGFTLSSTDARSTGEGSAYGSTVEPGSGVDGDSFDPSSTDSAPTGRTGSTSGSPKIEATTDGSGGTAVGFTSSVTATPTFAYSEHRTSNAAAATAETNLVPDVADATTGSGDSVTDSEKSATLNDKKPTATTGDDLQTMAWQTTESIGHTEETVITDPSQAASALNRHTLSGAYTTIAAETTAVDVSKYTPIGKATEETVTDTTQATSALNSQTLSSEYTTVAAETTAIDVSKYSPIGVGSETVTDPNQATTALDSHTVSSEYTTVAAETTAIDVSKYTPIGVGSETATDPNQATTALDSHTVSSNYTTSVTETTPIDVSKYAPIGKENATTVNGKNTTSTSGIGTTTIGINDVLPATENAAADNIEYTTNGREATTIGVSKYTPNGKENSTTVNGKYTTTTSGIGTTTIGINDVLPSATENAAADNIEYTTNGREATTVAVSKYTPDRTENATTTNRKYDTSETGTIALGGNSYTTSLPAKVTVVDGRQSSTSASGNVTANGSSSINNNSNISKVNHSISNNNSSSSSNNSTGASNTNSSNSSSTSSNSIGIEDSSNGHSDSPHACDPFLEDCPQLHSSFYESLQPAFCGDWLCDIRYENDYLNISQDSLDASSSVELRLEAPAAAPETASTPPLRYVHWCAPVDGGHQWLEVTFDRLVGITALKFAQLGDASSTLAASFVLSYRPASLWRFYSADSNQPEIFEMNASGDNWSHEVRFDSPIETNALRIHPEDSSQNITCIAVAIVGYTLLKEPRGLGVESGAIFDSQLAAQDSQAGHAVQEARLNGPLAWCAATTEGALFRLDLLVVSYVQGAVVQGLAAAEGPGEPRDSAWVTSLRFKLWEPEGKARYQTYQLDNSDWHAHTVMLRNPVYAQTVTIHRFEFVNDLCLRIELLGTMHVVKLLSMSFEDEVPLRPDQSIANGTWVWRRAGDVTGQSDIVQALNSSFIFYDWRSAASDCHNGSSETAADNFQPVATAPMALQSTPSRAPTQSTTQSTNQPTTQSTTQSTNHPTTQFTTQSTNHPTTHFTTQSTDHPTTQSTNHPTTQFATHSTNQPNTQSTTQSTPQSTITQSTNLPAQTISTTYSPSQSMTLTPKSAPTPTPTSTVSSSQSKSGFATVTSTLNPLLSPTTSTTSSTSQSMTVTPKSAPTPTPTPTPTAQSKLGFATVTSILTPHFASNTVTSSSASKSMTVTPKPAPTPTPTSTVAPAQSKSGFATAVTSTPTPLFAPTQPAVSHQPAATGSSPSTTGRHPPRSPCPGELPAGRAYASRLLSAPLGQPLGPAVLRFRYVVRGASPDTGLALRVVPGPDSQGEATTIWEHQASGLGSGVEHGYALLQLDIGDQVAVEAHIAPEDSDAFIAVDDINVFQGVSPSKHPWLGMSSAGNNRIRDDQLTVSSQRKADPMLGGFQADHARLNNDEGAAAWCADLLDPLKWFQVDFEILASVYGVVVQGRPAADEWVEQYSVTYSEDGVEWSNISDASGNRKVFAGTYDSSTPISTIFLEPIRTQFLRFHIVTWHGAPCVRLEFIGYKGKSLTNIDAANATEGGLGTTDGPQPTDEWGAGDGEGASDAAPSASSQGQLPLPTTPKVKAVSEHGLSQEEVNQGILMAEDLEDVYNALASGRDEVTVETAEVALAALSTKTAAGKPGQLTEAEVGAVTQTLAAVSQASGKSKNSAKDFLTVCDRLLSPNHTLSDNTDLTNASSSPSTSSSLVSGLLSAVDGLAESVGANLLVGNVTEVTIATDNLVLQSWSDFSDKVSGGSVELRPATSGNIFKLPLSSILDKDVKVTAVVFRTAHTAIASDVEGQGSAGGNATVGSEVVSLTVTDANGTGVAFSAESPIGLAFQLEQTKSPDYEAKCCFWKYTDSSNGGVWSTDGCQVNASSADATTCQCSHLTNFAVLLQLKETEIPAAHSSALDVLTYIGTGLSIASLLLSICVFAGLRLLKSQRIVIHVNLAASLTAAQVLYLAGIDATSNAGVCRGIAVCLHYLFTASFVWMLMEGVQLYTKSTTVFGKGLTNWMYMSIGWGIPLLIVGISMAARFDGYGMESSCWLSYRSGLIYAFVTPVLVVVALNTVILVLVLRVFMALKANADKSEKARIRAGVRAVLLLQPLLGFTWLFGFFSSFDDTLFFTYLFVIFNSSQGVFIFLLHCIGDYEVRKAMKKYRGRRTAPASSTGYSMVAPSKLSRKHTAPSMNASARQAPSAARVGKDAVGLSTERNARHLSNEDVSSYQQKRLDPISGGIELASKEAWSRAGTSEAHVVTVDQKGLAYLKEDSLGLQGSGVTGLPAVKTD